MGQNFCASVSERGRFCPMTCIFFARKSCRSIVMSSSVIDGLIIFGTTTCGAGSASRAILDPAEPHPCKAVIIPIPATNAPTNRAVSLGLLIVSVLLMQDSKLPSAVAKSCLHKIPHGGQLRTQFLDCPDCTELSSLYPWHHVQRDHACRKLRHAERRHLRRCP